MDKKLCFFLSLISSIQCLTSLFYYRIENTNDHKGENIVRFGKKAIMMYENSFISQV